MSYPFKLTGIVFNGEITKSMLNPIFRSNIKLIKQGVIVIEHKDYLLNIEQNLINADCYQFEDLNESLEKILQSAQLNYQIDVFEVDGRLIKRSQG